MSIIDQIKHSNSEGEILQLIEEHVFDEETSLSWLEEAKVLEERGERDKAEILKAAHKRCQELDSN